ncbi:hypothetical protein SDC9_70062 [bioreactor metagenome]|uniref:DUF1152 domain-containing protein n=1 Tax=bioreactor metagenome TaxID=1076179 RepID=A0A644Y6M0_9ZZZZ
MNNWTTPKPSVEELLRSCGSLLIAGCGGGGDLVQSISIMNYARTLGVKKICLATISVNWWGTYSDGCEVFDIDWFQPTEKLGKHAARILPNTQLTGGKGKGKLSYEIAVARLFDVPVYAIDLTCGLSGVREGLEDIVRENGCELFISADIGSDALFTGEETQVCSPLIDAMSVLCASEMTIPGVYALNGYGGDAEMHLTHLNRNVGEAMRRGGYLGASGITQKDVLDLTRVFDLMGPDDVEQWPCRAAKGELGVFYCKRLWGVERIPAAAVTFFFDPDVLCEMNPAIRAIKGTETLQQAEDAIFTQCGILSETRLALDLDYPMPPQYPDKK